MKIYAAEILDGLQDKITDNSIAMVCDISDQKEISISDLKVATASFHKPEQQDLYYLASILVSSGWNKNDDVFTVEDLWSAKDSPVDKPFNYMHDEMDIIGHMIASKCLDHSGNAVETEPLPEKMDIATAAVIYRAWSDTDQAKRIEDLITGIQEGKYKVSMECLFNNFDYAIISPNGEHKVIPRDETSAFLTKHLRAYGGSGEYTGYKVGRLLRNLVFSGKGLVDKPANPRSVILHNADPFNSNEISTAEVLMPEDTDALKQELESEKAKASQLASEIDGHKSVIQSLESKVAELELTIANISSEKQALSLEIQKMVAEAKASVRKASLISAGADEAKAEELMAKFAEASDEMFEAVVALIVKPAEQATSPSGDATEEEAEADEESVETDIDSAVVEETSTTVVEESTADRIKSAASFLRNNVLKSTASLVQE